MKLLSLFVIGTALACAAFGQTAALLPTPKHQFFDASGRPLAGGSLTVYASGTTTLVDTYVDATATAKNSNPIVLDAAGRASVFISPPNITGFVMSSAGAGAVVTVSGYSVTANDVGARIRIDSGTNFITGTFTIQSVNIGLNQWTFAASVTTGVGSNGAGAAIVGSYKIIAKNSANVQQWVTDGVSDFGQLLRQDLSDPSTGRGAGMVAFKQTDTGSVTRTLQEKASERLSVKDFGAVGDGATDDTANIQKALDALQTRNGGELFFPAGQYRITGNGLGLVNSTYRGYRLTGDGRYASQLLADGAAITLDLCGTDYVTIQDLSINGTGGVGLLLCRYTLPPGGTGAGGSHSLIAMSVFGSFSVASAYSIASESNAWLHSEIRNSANAPAYYTATSNVLGVVTTRGTIQTSTNSDTHIQDAIITNSNAGANSAGVVIYGNANPFVMRDSFVSTCRTSVYLTGAPGDYATGPFNLEANMYESYGSCPNHYGILVDGAVRVYHLNSIRNRFFSYAGTNADIYQTTGTGEISSSNFTGNVYSQVNLTGAIDLNTIRRSLINENATSVQIRGSATDCEITAPVVTFPAGSSAPGSKISTQNRSGGGADLGIVDHYGPYPTPVSSNSTTDRNSQIWHPFSVGPTDPKTVGNVESVNGTTYYPAGKSSAGDEVPYPVFWNGLWDSPMAWPLQLKFDYREPSTWMTGLAPRGTIQWVTTPVDGGPLGYVCVTPGGCTNGVGFTEFGRIVKYTAAPGVAFGSLPPAASYDKQIITCVGCAINSNPCSADPGHGALALSVGGRWVCGAGF